MSSDEEWLAAEERAAKDRQSGLYAVSARFDAETGTLHVGLKRGFVLSFSKQRAQVTAKATDEQLQDVEIDAGGWTIYFPKLDDGMTVKGMLEGRFGNRHWEQAWAEAQTFSSAA